MATIKEIAVDAYGEISKNLKMPISILKRVLRNNNPQFEMGGLLVLGVVFGFLLGTCVTFDKDRRYFFMDNIFLRVRISFL